MTVSIEIDPDDYIEDISDELIVSEYERRRLASNNDLCRTLIEAHEWLLRGKPAEARVVIERLLWPKWGTVRDCEYAYKHRR